MTVNVRQSLLLGGYRKWKFLKLLLRNGRFCNKFNGIIRFVDNHYSRLLTIRTLKYVIQSNETTKLTKNWINRPDKMQEITKSFLPHILRSEKAFLSATTLSVITFSITALSIMIFSPSKLSIKSLFVTLSVNDTQHKKHKRHSV